MPRKTKAKPRRAPRALGDRGLRTMIFKFYANPEIAADVNIEGMHKLFLWLKKGETPSGAEKKPRLVHSQPAVSEPKSR